MKSDGIIDCISAIDNFNESKKNPFGYFTKILWNAFIRRIQKEKKEQYIKFKNMENTITIEDCCEEEVNLFKFNEASNEIIKSFEKTLSVKKIDNKAKKC